MVGARHDRFAAGRANRRRDLLAVGCNHHTPGLRLHGPLARRARSWAARQ